MPPTVTLIVSSGRHQVDLPEALAHEGLVSRVIRSTPDLEVLEADARGQLRLLHRFTSQRVGSRLLWAIRNRLPVPWRGIVPLLEWSRVADYRIAKWLAPSSVFHGLLGVCQASLRRAKSLGAITLIDNPTLHPLAFRREVLADYAIAGIPPNDAEPVMPMSMVRRCELQFEICDRIVVYSAAAQKSFQPFAYAAKTVVVNPGVNHHIFTPGPADRSDATFRICYVGRIEAPKGIHHLIEAWKRLALPNAELLLIGRVLPGMRGVETEGPAAHIRLAGILSPEEVARCCRQSDLFVFPSMNEGLSLALLEAMSCGLPVVACQGTGAEDCVTPGKEGLLIPGRNVDALAEAILWCHGHRDQLPAMGRNARKRVEAEFTLAHYAERLMTLYRSVTNP